MNAGYYCKGWTIEYNLVTDGFQTNQSMAESCDQANQHIVVTMSTPGEMNLYADGTLVASLPLSETELPPSPTFYVGKSFAETDSQFTGSISEFRIWAGAMSPVEVAQYFAEDTCWSAMHSYVFMCLCAS